MKGLNSMTSLIFIFPYYRPSVYVPPTPHQTHMLQSSPLMWWYLRWGLWEVIRLRLGHKGESLMMGSVLLQKRKNHKGSLPFPSPPYPCSLCMHRKTCEDVSQEGNPKHWTNNCLLFKPLSLWYFVTAAWAD